MGVQREKIENPKTLPYTIKLTYSDPTQQGVRII